MPCESPLRGHLTLVNYEIALVVSRMDSLKEMAWNAYGKIFKEAGPS